MQVKKPGDALQEVIFFVLRHMPGAVVGLGHSSVFDLFESQLFWLVYRWNEEEKVKEKAYKKMRQKK